MAREVERRLSENLFDWEEQYKAAHLHRLKEAVAEELRLEFETRMQELLD